MTHLKVWCLVICLTCLVVLALSKPRHISGPDDRHVFSGETTTLTCEVEDVSELYAVAWQYFDGSGNGYIIGRCFGCSSDSDQCDPYPYGREHNYTVSKTGNIYNLTLSKLLVLNESSHGYYQCGYFPAQGCRSKNPHITGRFYLFQSAIVFVYDLPTCNIQLAQEDDGGFIADFTCMLEPRFYSTREVQAVLIVNGSQVETDIELPFGIMLRGTADDYTCVNVTLSGTRCNVSLPGKEVNELDCAFPNRCNETVSAFIEPLTAYISIGDEINVNETEVEMRCHAYPNSSIVRRWVFYQEGGRREEVSSSRRTMAGYVQFLSDTRNALTITPTSTGEFFIECIVDKDNNSGVVSAFASLNVSGHFSTTPGKTEDNEKTSPTSPSMSDGENSDDNNIVFILLINIPVAVIVIICLVVCGVIIWRRTHQKRSYKQPPRLPPPPSEPATIQTGGISVNTNESSVSYDPLSDFPDDMTSKEQHQQL